MLTVCFTRTAFWKLRMPNPTQGLPATMSRMMHVPSGQKKQQLVPTLPSKPVSPGMGRPSTPGPLLQNNQCSHRASHSGKQSQRCSSCDVKPVLQHWYYAQQPLDASTASRYHTHIHNSLKMTPVLHPASTATTATSAGNANATKKP